jgi:SpoVK/Ycf46/Vps4 family AAA+-type ATPase
MTTNHIELFDPALIRTGRFDIIIKLGYSDIKQANDIIKHNLGLDVDLKIINMTDDVLTKLKITPSDIENICQICQCKSDVLQNLNNLLNKRYVILNDSIDI